ncbi:MAG: hypothetical protein QG650_1095 [Patescibacteria group bacterium]|nr:hypothetical protein [Patescibacteria group bacterium]
MKDFFEAYRKSASKKNAAIVAAAFVFAVSVNALLFGTDAGVRIQTSAIQYAGGKAADVSADLTLSSAGTGSDLVKLKLERTAKDVKEIRATLVSDSSALQIKDVFSTDKEAEITKISNVDGMMLLNIRFAAPRDVAAGTELATAAYAKTGSGKTQIGLVETSFVSGDATYELSSSAIEL